MWSTRPSAFLLLFGCLVGCLKRGSPTDAGALVDGTAVVECDPRQLIPGIESLGHVHGPEARVDAALRLLDDACTGLPLVTELLWAGERAELDARLPLASPNAWARACPTPGPTLVEAPAIGSTDWRQQIWNTCSMQEHTYWTDESEWVAARGPVYLPLVVLAMIDDEVLGTEDPMLGWVVRGPLGRALAGLPTGSPRPTGGVRHGDGDPNLRGGICRVEVGLDTSGDQGFRMVPVQTGVIVRVVGTAQSRWVRALSCDDAGLGNIGPTGDDLFCDGTWYAIAVGDSMAFEPPIPGLDLSALAVEGCELFIR